MKNIKIFINEGSNFESVLKRKANSIDFTQKIAPLAISIGFNDKYIGIIIGKPFKFKDKSSASKYFELAKAFGYSLDKNIDEVYREYEGDNAWEDDDLVCLFLIADENFNENIAILPFDNGKSQYDDDLLVKRIKSS